MMSSFGVLSLTAYFFGLILILLAVAVWIVFEVLVLWVVSRILKLRRKDLKTAAYAVLATYAVSISLSVIQLPLNFLVKNWILSMLASTLFFAVGFAVSVYIVKRCYREGWLKALAAYLILFVATILAVIIVGIIIGALAFALLGTTLNSIGAGI